MYYGVLIAHEYGRNVDGALIKNEAFADLMAVRCCLKILEQKENPDYDLFFRTYARRKETISVLKITDKR